MKYDFSGWATRNDILCSDGRTIKKDAFVKNDGMKVPLVWNHQHNDASNILGHALLQNRPGGVYAYCSFNNNENGQTAKELVRNGDITALSIFATGLKQDPSRNVLHGDIKEVSLVLAGANKGAYIDNVSLQHSDGSYEEVADEAYISFIEDESISHSEVEYEAPAKTEEPVLQHAEEEAKGEENVEDKKKAPAGKTVQEIYDTLNDDQKELLNFMVAKALEDAKGGEEAEEENEDEEKDMKHNLFDSSTEMYDENVLSHAEIKGYANEITQAAVGDIKRYGSLRDSVLAHAEEYGIENLSLLFPDAKNITDSPEFIKRQTEWVAKVMNGTRHIPFSRIRSIFANITEDDARAKGYIKGKLKKEEVFSLLKRVTTPTTIFKKQKFNRDDIIDITDMDVIAFTKGEMRLMIDEELARAVLVGDGRLASSDDKIGTDHIRPIAADADLFTIKKQLTGADIATIAEKFVDEFVIAMDEYRGSGNPTMFIRQDLFTRLMLLKDKDGRRLYKTPAELATVLMVGEVVKMPTEIMGKSLAIAVNLNDYTIGADKGGEVSMFEDFDIDYNQQKYLLETRCSGALTKPFSAIAFSEEKVTTTDEAGGITGRYKPATASPHVGG
nr:MAG TPA: major capsid protein [Caudoviricetes sp.]